MLDVFEIWAHTGIGAGVIDQKKSVRHIRGVCENTLNASRRYFKSIMDWNNDVDWARL